ncbi:DUF4097 family beta strand repeat-containing protein [Microbacterium sp. A93]|uniref:DUF4097 family beta strand repeat-containing protein n=1 Tax=Microbacterium sp. A93 TaxID=3450716 RepID=UPI003F41FCA1
MNTEPQHTPGGARTHAGVTAITVTTAIVGGIALLGAGGTAAFAAVNDATVSSEAQSVEVGGIESLEMDVSASSVTVRFADVDEAQLQVEGSRGGWTMRRDGDELIVQSPRGLFDGWFGGGLFGNWFNDDERVVLTLPEALQDSRLDADFTLSAGSLDVDGAFDGLDIELGAGGLILSGSASSVDIDMSAGRADVNLADVEEADFTVAAGQVVAELAGRAPSEVTIDVSAGSLELTLPDVAYDVQQEVSAGSLDNNLQTSSNARNSVVVSLSAGSVDLHPGR